MFSAGIYVGCYLVEASLQSDLRCFYDDDCLQQLIDSLYLSHDNNTTILNYSSTTSRYKPDTSIQNIIENLMIEQWNNQTSYQFYFEQCQPQECSATYISQGNIIYIITTTIGLIGGLTKLYKFLVPILVKIVLRFIIPFLRRKLFKNRVTTS